jgi:hypothetical protein
MATRFQLGLFFDPEDGLSRPEGHSAAGRIRFIEKSNDLIGNRTRALPACSSNSKNLYISV